jgi:hypothetical protein
MKRKSLLFGLLAVLAAVFIFTGCANPSDGSDGHSGAALGGVDATSIDADYLAVLFANADIITLSPAVQDVDGVIPSGKKLIVTRPNNATPAGTKVGNGFEVNGTLEIAENAVLYANYSGGAGYLVGNGAITGKGAVVLPYLVGTNTAFPSDGIDYGRFNGSPIKIAGTYFANSGNGPLTNTIIRGIFNATDGPTDLNVGNVADLVATTVPSGKKLAVYGDTNILASLDLSSAGTLEVYGNLTVSATALTITGNASATNITIKGDLILDASVAAFTVANKVDLSGAAVDASALTADATLTLPSGIVEVRRIRGNNNGDLTIAGATELVIGGISGFGGKAVKSASVTKYTVAGTEGPDSIGGTAADLVVLGLSNSVFEINPPATLTTKLNITGNAKVAGNITATNTTFPLTTLDLEKLSYGSSITYTDAVTGAAEVLVIPEDVNVIATIGVFGSVTGFKISDDASLVVGSAFAPSAVTIPIGTEGDGRIVAADAATFTKIVGQAADTVTGFTVGINGVDIIATDLAAIGTKNITIDILGGTTAIDNAAAIDVTNGTEIIVSYGGTLDVIAGDADAAAGHAVTVSVPVTVYGTLNVTGGVGSTAGNYVGGAALVKTVTAHPLSVINVTAGAGGADTGNGTGGTATIGAAAAGTQKIAFILDEVTPTNKVTVTVTGGAAAANGTGGAAALYTSDTVATTAAAVANSEAIIDGVKLTLEIGAKHGGGVDGIVGTGSGAVTAAGGTHG